MGAAAAALGKGVGLHPPSGEAALLWAVTLPSVLLLVANQTAAWLR